MDDLVKRLETIKIVTGVNANFERLGSKPIDRANETVQEAAVHIKALTAERDELRAWDDHFRSACGYKRDGRSSPECLDDWVGKVFAVEADLQARLDEAEAKLAQAVQIAHGYHVKACKRMENDPAEYDRHAECASTAGSIAHAIRALATIQPEGQADDKA